MPKIKPIAYVFSGKKTTQEGNTVSVKFIHGVSDTFPHKHKKMKDFHCQEMHEGDFSEIYMPHDELVNLFELHYAAVVGNLGDTWEKYQYRYNLTRDQWYALTALSLLHTDLAFSHLKIEEEEQFTITLLPGYLSVPEHEIIPMIQSFSEVSTQIYDDEILQFSVEL